MKIVLNVLSTLGHVLIGKVAGNRMIDVAVSNNKLYYRAIRIVSDVGGVGEQKAEDCLLRSIYGVDEVSEEMLKESIAGRIAIAEVNSWHFLFSPFSFFHFLFFLPTSAEKKARNTKSHPLGS